MSIFDDLAIIARRVTGDMTYERLYAAEVVRVAGDLADVLPDDPRVRGRGLQGVLMPTIDPTTELAPEPGCRCLLGFREGDSRRPYIAAWEYAADSATVRIDGGVGSVARKGDLIDVLLPVGIPTAVSGIAQGIQLPTPQTPVTVPPTPFTATVTLMQSLRASPIGGAPAVKA